MATRKKQTIAVVEDNRVYDYELLFIISPEVADDALEAVIEGVSQLITSKEGVISEVERWGKKRLSYPVKHFLDGNYVLARFQLKPTLGKELEAQLRITEDILRHLLIRVR